MCPWERGRPARMDKRGPAAHCGRDARAPREPDPRSRSGSRPVGPRRSLDDHGSTSVIREPGDVESSGSCRDAVAQQDNGPVIFLMGPTAAGKTRIAAELAASGPYEIVSVDSALVFRHLDIGTGKPDRDLLARAPHRLIDIRNPDQRYSAAEFRDEPLRAANGKWHRHQGHRLYVCKCFPHFYSQQFFSRRVGVGGYENGLSLNH